MPRTPVGYGDAVIYKIVCRDLGIRDCYIGSTTCLRRRRCSHKHDCNHPEAKQYNYPLYRFIREHGGWEQWDAILVEPFPCSNGEELHARERYWIETLGATLNSQLPSRTRAEWQRANPEKTAEYGRKYRQSHPEQMALKNRRWRESHRRSPEALAAIAQGNPREGEDLSQFDDLVAELLREN